MPRELSIVACPCRSPISSLSASPRFQFVGFSSRPRSIWAQSSTPSALVSASFSPASSAWGMARWHQEMARSWCPCCWQNRAYHESSWARCRWASGSSAPSRIRKARVIQRRALL
jgi:hypothetical protein